MARRSPARVIGGRLLQALPVILLATFMVFALLKLVPGDIAVTLAGDNATDARITEIRKIYGLDRPFLVQYGAWLANVVQGDLSQSLLTGEKVATSIARAFPNTLLIVAIALVLALVSGIPMGVIAAIKPNGWVDKVVSLVASLGVAIPGFWLAMILVAEISLKLNWLPATGAKSFSASPWEAIRRAAPGIAIAAYGMAEVGAAVAWVAAGSAVLAICADAARQGAVDDAHPLAARPEEERQRQPVHHHQPFGQLGAAINSPPPTGDDSPGGAAMHRPISCGISFGISCGGDEVVMSVQTPPPPPAWHDTQPVAVVGAIGPPAGFSYLLRGLPDRWADPGTPSPG